MAIRVEDLAELQRLASVCTGDDAAGNWSSLSDYLNHAAIAATEPVPYVRDVDVLWLGPPLGLPGNYCQDRRFRVTYAGRVRAGGGFASQGYCVLDPAWNVGLQPHHQVPITVEWHGGADRDLLVIGP